MPPKSYWNMSRLDGQTKARLIDYFCMGVPAYRLRFHIKASQKAVQRFFKLLRVCLYQNALPLLSEDRGTFEMDETMFGGYRPGHRGWGAAGKVLVFGIYKRNGEVITFPISSRSRKQIEPLVTEHTPAGSLYYTDDWHAYATLYLRGVHVVVDKRKGVPKGRAHINGIEGFWSYAKHWLYTYRGVQKDYFPLYLKEIEWRFNHRNENLIPILKSLTKKTIPDQQLLKLWV